MKTSSNKPAGMTDLQNNIASTIANKEQRPATTPSVAGASPTDGQTTTPNPAGAVEASTPSCSRPTGSSNQPELGGYFRRLFDLIKRASPGDLLGKVRPGKLLLISRTVILIAANVALIDFHNVELAVGLILACVLSLVGEVSLLSFLATSSSASPVEDGVTGQPAIFRDLRDGLFSIVNSVHPIQVDLGHLPGVLERTRHADTG